MVKLLTTLHNAAGARKFMERLQARARAYPSTSRSTPAPVQDRRRQVALNRSRRGLQDEQGTIFF